MDDDLWRLAGGIGLALLVSTFIRLVRSYRPSNLSALCYDIPLIVLLGLLAAWPYGWAFARQPDLGNFARLLLDTLMTLVGALLGGLCARGIGHWLSQERRTVRRRD